MSSDRIMCYALRHQCAITKALRYLIATWRVQNYYVCLVLRKQIVTYLSCTTHVLRLKSPRISLTPALRLDARSVFCVWRCDSVCCRLRARCQTWLVVTAFARFPARATVDATRSRSTRFTRTQASGKSSASSVRRHSTGPGNCVGTWAVTNDNNLVIASVEHIRELGVLVLVHF